MADVCRSCKAPVRWAVTDSGTAIPLDAEPVDGGNIRLAGARVPGGTPRAVIVPDARRAEFAGELYVAHFATCPDAGQHRRRR